MSILLGMRCEGVDPSTSLNLVMVTSDRSNTATVRGSHSMEPFERVHQSGVPSASPVSASQLGRHRMGDWKR